MIGLILAVVGRIWIAHLHANLLVELVYRALPHLGFGRPLARRGVQADVTISGYPLPLLYDTDTSLVTFRVIVLGQHDIDSLVFQVFLTVEFHS